MFSSVDLSLNIQNNVNYPVQINVLGNPYNLLDTSNAKTEYRWDFTSFTFTNQNQIIIQYKQNSETSFTTYSGQLGSQTLQAIVDILNNLGIGFFNLYTELGNTYIGTYNDNYTFGQMNVFSSLGIVNPNFFVGNGFDIGTFQAPPSLLRQIRLQSNGKIIAGGYFDGYQSNIKRNILRINTDGTFDTTFNIGGVGLDSYCDNLAIQSDDKIVCVGQFNLYNAVSSPGKIIRLNSDGTKDTTYNTGTGFGVASPWGIAIQTDGKVICVGNFTTYQGNIVNGIVRINTNGTYDNTFNFGGAGFAGGTGNKVYAITIQSNGKIICVGDFTSYNGNAVGGTVRINTDGTYDNTFSSTVNNTAWAVALQNDGKVLIGGIFNFPGFYIYRTNSNGTIDNTFTNAGFDSLVTNIVLQTDGKILVSGTFTLPTNGIVRLNTDGSVDSTFNVGTGLNSTNTNQPIQLSNSNIILGGTFSTFDGQPYNNIVELLS
jgi:uncharacterized delta-60 repeat protein